MNQEELKCHLKAHMNEEWAGVQPKKTPSIVKAVEPTGSTTLQELKDKCAECTRCELYKTATNVVFSDGNPALGLVFIGEAPGADEDAQGLPFVGRAGKLLTATIQELGVARPDVYICNILKHRPPENRNPLPSEIEACTPFLVEQLALIKPKLIVTLGNFSSKFILGTEEGITKLRGKIMDSRFGYKVLPTLHPAAILRNMNYLPDFKADLALALEWIKKH